MVWSFGNNLRDYLYSKEIEPLKKAIHYAIFFRDYSLGKDLGYDLSFIEPISDIQRRYAAVKRYFSQFGHFQQQSFEGGQRIATNCKLNTSRGGGQNHRDCRAQRPTNGSIPTFSLTGGKSHQPDWKQSNDLQTSVRTSTSRMPQPSLRDSKKKKSTGRTLQRRTSQLHCTDCNTGSDNYPCREIRGGQFSNITSSVLDYAKVEIPDDSVIYCDIPYEDTNVYNKAEGFDYERFYDWCEHQTQPVFISSYQMPDDRFDCIEEFSHRSTLSATANNLVTERIYVPKHQKERGNRAIQLSLF